MMDEGEASKEDTLGGEWEERSLVIFSTLITWAGFGIAEDGSGAEANWVGVAEAAAEFSSEHAEEVGYLE